MTAANDITIRPAKPGDRERIAAIQAASPEAAAWDPEGYECWVAVDEKSEESNVMGFAVTRPVAPAEFEILNLAVAPAYRRRGVAKALVENVALARPGRWFLEVRASNEAARRLYESMGFERSGVRENYYHNPTEAAIVMSLQS